MSEEGIVAGDKNEQHEKRNWWQCWRKPGRTLLCLPTWAFWFLRSLRWQARECLSSYCKYRVNNGFWKAVGYWVRLAWVSSRPQALLDILVPSGPGNGSKLDAAFIEHSIKMEIKECEAIVRHRATPREWNGYFYMALSRWREKARGQLYHRLDWLIPWDTVRSRVIYYFWPVRLLPRYDFKFWERIQEWKDRDTMFSEYLRGEREHWPPGPGAVPLDVSTNCSEQENLQPV